MCQRAGQQTARKQDVRMAPADMMNVRCHELSTQGNKGPASITHEPILMNRNAFNK